MQFNLDEIIKNNETNKKYVYKDTKALGFEFRYVGLYTYNIEFLYGEGLYRIMFFVNDLKRLRIKKQIFTDKDENVANEKFNEIKNFFFDSSIEDLTKKFVEKNDNF